MISEKTQNIFSQRLREIMEEQGIKQSELCTKTGIKRSAMSQYLGGAFLPKGQRLRAIAKALDVSDDWLLGYDVPKARIEVAHDGSEFKTTIIDNSMDKVHIPCGAFVTVHKCTCDTLKNGDVVCFSIGTGKPLVRYYHNNGANIVLTAVNPYYEPIIINHDKIDNGEVILHGIVKKVSFTL